ncbi:MAG: ABC transporter permease [Clostridiaceae bacterium]
MRQFITLIKKEFTELFRTGKAAVLLIVFVIFGIMNPALAKLTPWMLNLMSDSLAEAGVTIGSITVDAMTAWTQYFKNLFMEYVLVLALFCGTLTNECQSGTLVNLLAKGLPRWKVIAAKFFTMLVCWSVCYYLTFGITFGYSAYFWDNSIAQHLGLAAFCSYLLGVWLLALVMLFSAFFRSGMYVLLASGAVYGVSYALGALPALAPYLPARLDGAFGLLAGAMSPGDFSAALIVAAALSVLAVCISIAGFQKKQL